jgi:hypothetical protein
LLIHILRFSYEFFLKSKRNRPYHRQKQYKGQANKKISERGKKKLPKIESVCWFKTSN